MAETKEKRTRQLRDVAEIRADLERTGAVLSDLEAENASIVAQMKDAARSSRAAWEEAALTGKPLKQSSQFAQKGRRAEELPGLVWAAKMRHARLRIELRQAQQAEAERLEAEAAERAAELAPRARELEAQLNEAEGEAHAQRMEKRMVGRDLGEAERELELLERRGPEAPATRSTLRPRPNLISEEA